MRRVFQSVRSGAIAVAVILALSASTVAAPRDNVDRERGRSRGIVQVVKKIIQALGDGLTIPRP